MTISWRAKLTLMAGVTLIATGLMLAFAGPGASGATVSLPVGGSPTQHPTGPPSKSPTPSPTLTGSQAPVTTSPSPSPTAAANQDPTSTKGDNGTVKIHNPSTAVADRRNEPHVSCGFYLDAFGFDSNQSVTWWITAWAPTGDRATTVAAGTIKLVNGNGFTDPITTLEVGHYKLFWTFDGEKGHAKQKVFWVTSTCSSKTGSPPPSNPETPSSTPPSSGGVTPPSPHGGLPITGWPLAVLVAGAAALLGTGTAAIVVARRRRGLQSSR